MKRIDKKNIRWYILILISSAMGVFAFCLSSNIYNASFEQYIFSLIKSVGVVGSASLKYLIEVFYGFIIYIVLSVILIIPTVRFDKKISVMIKRKGEKKEWVIFPIGNVKRYARFIFVFSLVFLGIRFGFFDYVFNSMRKTDLFLQYYTSPGEVDIEFPSEKQNLIYIFMESTEMTNVSKSNGGAFDVSIMPNLERYALDYVNFSNRDTLGGAVWSYGTGWTASAMIAQSAGIPLKMMISDVNSDSTVFSNIVTIGDILHDNGYTNLLMLGSDASFGGRRSYFESHNYLISDYYTAIEEGKISSDYHEWWGYEDAKLFSYAKEELLKLSESGEAFNLTLLTADTHFTDGYLDKSCSNVFSNPYANSFYCSDSMIGEFVSWIMKQDFYKNTTIVISGDHLTMQDNFYANLDDDYTRTIYNVFINSRVMPVNNKNRTFTTMDMFPTTLGALGVSIQGDRLGLGTNLFSGIKTIPEEIGMDVILSILFLYYVLLNFLFLGIWLYILFYNFLYLDY